MPILLSILHPRAARFAIGSGILLIATLLACAHAAGMPPDSAASAPATSASTPAR